MLQPRHKAAVALIGNYGQAVDIVHSPPQPFGIHALATLVHTQAKSTPYLLMLGDRRLGMA